MSTRSTVSSGAPQNSSFAGVGYQKIKKSNKQANKQQKKTSNTEAVTYCCKVMTGDGSLWQVSVCWDVPSITEARLLYVKTHRSMWKRDIPQGSALTPIHWRKQQQLLKCHCLSRSCTPSPHPSPAGNSSSVCASTAAHVGHPSLLAHQPACSLGAGGHWDVFPAARPVTLGGRSWWQLGPLQSDLPGLLWRSY